MSEDEVTLGPGTDLVISLFAVSLLLVGMLTSLYSKSVEREVAAGNRVEQLFGDLKHAGAPDDPSQLGAWIVDLRWRLARYGDVDLDARELRSQLEMKRKELAAAQRELSDYRSRFQQAADEAQGLKQELARLQAVIVSDKPVSGEAKAEDDSDEVVRFRHQEGNRFDSGSHAPNRTFRDGIEKRVIPRIRSLAQKHGQHRVIVEIFGFTDGEPVSTQPGGCTLDRDLVSFNLGLPVTPLPCSNTDLAKLRADAVGIYTRQLLESEHLSSVRVLGYSAGQTIGPNDEVQTSNDPNPDPARRFVDVRFRIESQPVSASHDYSLSARDLH